MYPPGYSPVLKESERTKCAHGCSPVLKESERTKCVVMGAVLL